MGEKSLPFKAVKNKIVRPSWYSKTHYFWAKKKPSTDNKIIFCVDINPSDYSKLCSETHARAASRWNASYHVVRDHASFNGAVLWEKFRVAEYLKRGFRALVIDNDAAITHDCPDMFRTFPAGQFYIHDEFTWNKDPKIQQQLLEGVNIAARSIGVDKTFNKSKTYYNAGVFLADPKHAWVFQHGPWFEALDQCWLPEQDYLNVLLHLYKREIRPHSLPVHANCFNPAPGSSPWIVHAAGHGPVSKYQKLSLWV
jgi:hypothetical protein